MEDVDERRRALNRTLTQTVGMVGGWVPGEELGHKDNNDYTYIHVHNISGSCHAMKIQIRMFFMHDVHTVLMYYLFSSNIHVFTFDMAVIECGRGTLVVQ